MNHGKIWRTFGPLAVLSKLPLSAIRICQFRGVTRRGYRLLSEGRRNAAGGGESEGLTIHLLFPNYEFPVRKLTAHGLSCS